MGEATQLQVDRWTDVLSGHIERNPRFWIRLASLETKLLMDRLAPVPIDRPIYVAGLARSGSTILLELVAQHPDVATHRYRDFPPVLTPWLWNWFVDRAARKEHVATERAHRDRIKVTPESPEAFEEVIWMAFFPELHDPETSAVLDERSEKPAFEAFYRDHIRKLLLARGGSRYAAKGNYNVTRLRYLQKLFPDARFILPIRDPVWHIASLMKQHELFCREGRRDERIDRHLRRSGHFEFGLGRRAINTGDTARAERVMQLWDAGHEVEGWAEYWASVYGHVAETLDRHPSLRAATTVVRYEDLCADPASIVHATLASSGLPPGELPETARAMIQAPTYYKPSFSDAELALIHARTEAVARRFGYAEPVAATTLKARTGS
jgi:hypothetical protein